MLAMVRKSGLFLQFNQKNFSLHPDRSLQTVLIPTSSVKDFESGVVHLNNTSEFVDENYKFE